jgi:hypothetical protein
MLNKQKVKGFRSDFEKAVAQLEKDYGVAISLGTIRFDAQELRAKMTAKVGDAPVKALKDDFQIGDVVGINHKKVSPNDEFKIIKTCSIGFVPHLPRKYTNSSSLLQVLYRKPSKDFKVVLNHIQLPL